MIALSQGNHDKREAMMAQSNIVQAPIVGGLLQTLDGVRATLGRALSPDEVVLAGHMHRGGKNADAIAAMLHERPAEVPDSALVTRRAEMRGGRIVPLPDAEPA